MNISKFIAGVLACCIAGGAMPSLADVAGNTAVTANAVSYKEGTYEQLTYNKYKDHIEIARCDRSAAEVVIPAEIDGLPVTSIGDFAFYKCESLTYIAIPDSVASIGSGAFCWCSSLADIKIPDSVTSINEFTFNSCLSFTNIIIPDSVTSIGKGAFWSCSSLTDITIPNSVTSIGDATFECCTSLAEITIPNGVTSIGEYTFYGCINLTEITILNPECEIFDSAYTISNGYNDDYELCFYGIIYGYENSTAQEYAEKYGNKFVSLSEAPEIIGGEEEYTEGTYEQLEYRNYGDYIEISYCNLSAKEAVIPAEIEGLPVKSIGYQAFFDCRSLTSVTIPDSVTNIGIGAFLNCSSLADITIPDSVASIEGDTFCGCSSLTDITIPESVTSIGGKAFYDTPWLEEKQKENPFVIVNGILIDGTACSYYVTIPDSVKSIGDLAFYWCSNLIGATIPDSVKSIGESAFDRCSNLESITIPSSVASIGRCAFGDCSSLADVTISNGALSIGNIAFIECSNLTSITIPESVASIGSGAFAYCSSLESIAILNPECEIADSEFTIYSRTKIQGYANSTAQAYAEKYGNKFVSLGEAPETAGGDALIGDANCDGMVDLADATAIIQHIGNESKYALSEQGYANADCNSDGKITGADALAIQKLEAKLISSLPDVN